MDPELSARPRRAPWARNPSAVEEARPRAYTPAIVSCWPAAAAMYWCRFLLVRCGLRRAICSGELGPRVSVASLTQNHGWRCPLPYTVNLIQAGHCSAARPCRAAPGRSDSDGSGTMWLIDERRYCGYQETFFCRPHVSRAGAEQSCLLQGHFHWLLHGGGGGGWWVVGGGGPGGPHQHVERVCDMALKSWGFSIPLRTLRNRTYDHRHLLDRRPIVATLALALLFFKGAPLSRSGWGVGAPH